MREMLEHAASQARAQDGDTAQAPVLKAILPPWRSLVAIADAVAGEPLFATRRTVTLLCDAVRIVVRQLERDRLIEIRRPSNCSWMIRRRQLATAAVSVVWRQRVDDGGTRGAQSAQA
jgi:hypothetical protein